MVLCLGKSKTDLRDFRDILGIGLVEARGARSSQIVVDVQPVGVVRHADDPGRDAIAYVTRRTTANAARKILCDFDCTDVLLVLWGLLTTVHFAAAITATAPLEAFSISAATACGCDT